MIEKMEKFLLPITDKVSNNRYLKAIQETLISTLPITMISSLTSLIVNLPFPKAYVEFMTNAEHLKSFLLQMNQMGMNLLSIYIAYTLGAKLSKSRDLDETAGGISSLYSFLITMTTITSESESGLSLQYLGATGIFTTIITSIISVEVLNFAVKKRLTIKLPDSVPSNISRTFEAIIPVALSGLLINFIVNGVGINVNSIINTAVTPLLSSAVNSIFFPLTYVILTAIMWFFGIHPGVLYAIAMPMWIVNANANMAALSANAPIPNIGVKPFIFTFIYIGGGGGTLPLVVQMMRSKSKQLKTLGRLSLAPGIFNINEPVLFGTPVVLNPVLIIPFTLGMVATTIVTYVAFTTNLVPGMGNPLAAEPTVPSILAAFIATNSWKGIALVIVNFVISYLIYLPFFKVFEKQTLLEEESEEVAV